MTLATFKWPTKKLAEACDINPSSKEVSSISGEVEVSFVPMSAVSEDGKLLQRQKRKLSEVKKGFTYFRDGDVLVAKITPCMENGKRWLARSLENGIGFGSTEFHVLRPKSAVTSDWIYYFISQRSFREKAEKSMTGTAGQKRVPKRYLESLEILLPPLELQRRIVKVLDTADNLREMQAQSANQLANQVTQSIFLKMFGDTLENPKNWPIEEVENISFDIQPGFAFGKFSLDKGIPHLRPFNISASGWLEMKQVKYVPEKNVPPDHLLGAGDVIFNNTNSEELVGKTAIFRLPIKATLSNHMTRIRLDRKKALPEYVWFAFNRLFQRGVFARMCKRWVNQAAVDTTQLLHLKIPVPDIDGQKKFAVAIAKTETLMQAQSRSNREIGELFHAVIHKALRGELALRDTETSKSDKPLIEV